ncbi:plant UBX domain-containing protein 11 isoform X2 [Ricinus communis]|uniref:plant UBX domain-containing protein 11 isoform X2 n=1 Tax=Ricinus communis TaxID=3988 RepID=UPI00201A4EFA|nr:plant UBX domain-containing protein 11 isoform X2 [Ricinus communis]
MEHSLSAFTYKGSIPQAIIESKNQKKLFVVYISGSDAESVELEKCTWTDFKVAESFSKYCILLHLQEGSTDAVNFSAIYPYKSVPSIVAIGYNGVQLWQSGFISAEVLASNLEKAWLSLHIQETTATVLTAALASKKPELSIAGSSDVGPTEKETSSGTVVQSASADKHVQPSDAISPAACQTIKENKSHEHIVEERGTKHVDKRSSESSKTDKSRSIGTKESTSPTEEAKGSSSMIVDRDNSIADDYGHPDQEFILNHHPGRGDSQLATTETNEGVRDEGKADIIGHNERVNAPSDVHLNIRLPSGVSLQDRFSVASSLRMVKDYVDRNQASEIGSYDLAIPYPRKVFRDEDLSKSLSELELFNRQALMVVPRQRSTSYQRGGSSSDNATTSYSDSSTANNGGYFAHIRRMLSYINPLSYLGGNTSSSSSGQPQTGMWEYSPNSAPQSNIARTENSYSDNLPNQGSSATGRNDNRSRQPTTSRIGSNIHTLKHDEDDGRFSDRNPFWNGNSTQYGGNSDGK